MYMVMISRTLDFLKYVYGSFYRYWT